MLLVNEILDKYGRQIVEQIKTDIKSKSVTEYGAVNASGKLHDSIRHEVQDGVLRVYAKDYIYYIEYGRGPNKDKDDKVKLRKFVGWAGSTFLKEWVEKKGIDISPYSIAYKIARSGTVLFRKGGSNLLGDILTPQLIGDIRSDIILSFNDATVRSISSQILKLAA